MEADVAYANTWNPSANTQDNRGANRNANANAMMTWDDVYNTQPDASSSLSSLTLNPNSLIQSYTPLSSTPTPQHPHQHPYSHTYPHPHQLSFPPHPVDMGTQWHFSGDTFSSPYNKWSMEEICPTVSSLMPSIEVQSYDG